MRNQLEAKVAASQAEVQVVRASAHAETLQLQAAIFTLRSELEAARLEREKAIEGATSAFARERATLQQQITVMRELLEKLA